MPRKNMIRVAAEFIGVGAVVLSLVFVGFEIKQTREMNYAELHASRTAIEHSRYITMLESDHAVSFWAKQYPNLSWKDNGLSPTERAAAEMRAFALWLEYKLEYKFIELGFETRELDALRTDIRAVVVTNPEMIAVWRRWWYFPQEKDPFMLLVNKTLREAGIEPGDETSMCREAKVC